LPGQASATASSWDVERPALDAEAGAGELLNHYRASPLVRITRTSNSFSALSETVAGATGQTGGGERL